VREHVTMSWRLEAGHAVLRLATPARTYPPVRVGLAGAHQAGNAAVAVCVLEALAARTRFAVDADAIVAGLRDVRWPARLEWLRDAAGRRVLIDAAHNPAGAQALASYLDETGTGPITLVTSVMRDKDVSGVLSPLLRRASRVIVTRADTPRAADAAALAATVQALSPGLEVEAVDDPSRAVSAALAQPEPVVIAGSIFLVGPLRAALLAEGRLQPA
jgi:dihydrofolate synthase/folylpolyglutamate synthase